MTRPLVPLDDDERLVAEVRCGGNGGKCQALLGQVRQHRGAPGPSLTLHKPGRWEGWCPLTFEGGTCDTWGAHRYAHARPTRSRHGPTVTGTPASPRTGTRYAARY